jgi:hypothetical protein
MIVSGEFGTSKTFATWQPPSAPIVSTPRMLERSARELPQIHAVGNQ